MSLRDQLFRSLDNAVENGYIENFEGSGKTIYECDPDVLVIDTKDCDADLEDADCDELRLLCIEWQHVRKPA